MMHTLASKSTRSRHCLVSLASNAKSGRNVPRLVPLKSFFHPSTTGRRNFILLRNQTAAVSSSLVEIGDNTSQFCYSSAIAFFLTAITAYSTISLSTSCDSGSSQAHSLDKKEEDDDEETTVVNWSGTHSVEVPSTRYYEPETVQELESIVAKCHNSGTPLRPVGSALSPNGISFQPGGMVSLAGLDRVIKVDKEKMTVTVEAGARVSHVVDALREYNLTLPNLASIAEQQMGGFVQIGAHGTGANIPPVDEFVTSLKLVSPEKGVVELSEKDGEEFLLARVGLGCLGVLTEITMKCIPAHNLVEHTFVLTRDQAKERLNSLLQQHKHVRYMWIPFEDTVVVVTNDPEDNDSEVMLLAEKINRQEKKRKGINPFQAMHDLLIEVSTNYKEPYTKENLIGMGFGEVRDALLAHDPLNYDHVRRVNKAEALFWRSSEGYQMKPSDQLLQFDCGGQQWVLEVCFPTGVYGGDSGNNGNDMTFMENLLSRIESSNIAAPAPIEQRWSASSSSMMSPAHGPPGGLHCWVGIIMYLPSDDENQRKKITNQFLNHYCNIVKEVGDPLAVSHWAKLERPTSHVELIKLQALMKSRYPLEKFDAARLKFDPKNILGNELMNTVLRHPVSGNNHTESIRQGATFKPIV